MQAFGKAAALHHPAGKLVNQDNFIVFDDVVFVPMKQFVRPKRLIGVMNQGDVGRLVERSLKDSSFRQQFLDPLIAFFTEHDGALLFVVREILGGQARNEAIDDLVKFGTVVGWTRNDQRRPAFVDEDRIHLVNHREPVTSLNHVRERVLHVVAKIVEAEFVIGAVGDVAGVRQAALVVVQSVNDLADRHSEEAINAAHPVRIAIGEIVVDGDDMHALAFEGVEIDRRRCDKGLSLAGSHFGDRA